MAGWMCQIIFIEDIGAWLVEWVVYVCIQVHTFYEAVGLMISAQTETTTQERLIEKYMQLPNQVWDNIITQATQASQSSSA